jgi:hypothetical protein
VIIGIKILTRPKPWTGALGLFEIPDALIAEGNPQPFDED